MAFIWQVSLLKALGRMPGTRKVACQMPIIASKKALVIRTTFNWTGSILPLLQASPSEEVCTMQWRPLTTVVPNPVSNTAWSTTHLTVSWAASPAPGIQKHGWKFSTKPPFSLSLLLSLCVYFSLSFCFFLFLWIKEVTVFCKAALRIGQWSLSGRPTKEIRWIQTQSLGVRSSSVTSNLSGSSRGAQEKKNKVFKGQKKHIKQFNISSNHPTLAHFVPPKLLCASYPGEESKNLAHIIYSMGFWGRHKRYSLCVSSRPWKSETGTGNFATHNFFLHFPLDAAFWCLQLEASCSQLRFFAYNTVCLLAPCGWEFNPGRGRGWESGPLSRFCVALVLRGFRHYSATIARLSPLSGLEWGGPELLTVRGSEIGRDRASQLHSLSQRGSYSGQGVWSRDSIAFNRLREPPSFFVFTVGVFCCLRSELFSNKHLKEL